ncbi:MAG: DUF3857 domain-containing protein [Acidobacteriota bacterium]
MFITLSLLTFSLEAALNWKPITPAELELKAPKLDPKADAEAIFWEAWVEDGVQGGYALHRTENYIRIKLFNARAVEKWGNVEVRYSADYATTISDFRGRVIKPDGSITEVKGDQVKESKLAKSGRLNLRQASFAFPGLAPGVIIEYQYTETISGAYLLRVKLPIQLDVPAWNVNYYVKPLGQPYISGEMRSYPFNCNPSPWAPVKSLANRGMFVSTSVVNVPAHIEEPNMPAEDDTRAWILLYYSEETERKPEKYWKSLGKKLNDEYRKDVKSSGEIKALAAELTKDKPNPQAKADALAVFCQTKIKNTAYAANGITAQERENFFKKLKNDNYNAADTLKNKIGTPFDILALFFSLAEAAGLEPVFVAGSSADGALFRADLLNRYLLRNRFVAIKTGTEWAYYNPGIPYLPPGMLDVDEQGQAALLCDPKDPKLIMAPFSQPEYSVLDRKANLKMAEDGSIDGVVEVSHYGHFAVQGKRDLDSINQAEREERTKKSLEARYPGAQITELKVENADVPMGVFRIAYKIHMDNFGQRTGKRLFFQPAFFNFGDSSLFSASGRKHPIAFPHAFSESDKITIEYPENLKLEQAEIPGTLKLGELGTISLSASVDNKKPFLYVIRRLNWGNKGGIFFGPETYGALKQAWDGVHQINIHQLTLRAQ